jgi:predicted CopG family antitoxin
MYRIKFIQLVSYIFVFNLIAYSQSDITKIYSRLHQINKTTQVQILNSAIPIGTQTGELALLSGSNNINFNGKTLLVGVNGTGRLYQIDSNLTVTRLDKTEYGGSNFGSSDFLLHDTLFSIGGYGFWNTNGALRYFNQNTYEWDIIKTNVNIPFANGINARSYFDPVNEKIHLIYNQYYPEYISRKIDGNAVCFYQCLDLKTKKWLQEPFIIHSKLTDNYSGLTFIQTLPDGIILNSKNYSSTLFINFRKNKVYKLNDSKYTEFIQLKNRIKNAVLLTTDSSMYLYDIANDTLNEYAIDSSELTVMPFPLYVTNTNFKTNWMDLLYILLIILSVGFGILFVIYFNKYKKSKKNKQNDFVSINESEKKTISDFIQNLTEIERQLLELLVRNNWNNMNTSVNQINKILGTEKKDVKIQNNIRGEIINQINNKFLIYSSINDQLIDRQRVEFDKRYVEYFINEKLILKFPKKVFD